MSTILKTGPAPHIRTAETVESVMYDVVIALIPAFAMAVYSFGVRALILTAVSVATCIATEYIWQKILKRDIEAFDGSAILTGILFAFVVPVGMGLQYVIVGNFVAITTFAYDGKAGATVLDAMKRGIPLTDSLIYEGGNQYINAFLGQMGGCLGETSALALLIGGVYLIYKKQIDWKVPAVMIGTVFVLTWAMGANPFMQILSGGLFLGAFFMATDMVTSPITGKGRVIFALGIGILVSLIRIKGGYPEGTAYAILIMNGVVPLIDRYIRAKKFGGVSKNGK